MYVEQVMTQQEIADKLGVTLKRVQTAMRKFGIVPRRQVRREPPKGERNPLWKGDAAGYRALHVRVAVARGTPMECERCGTDDPAKTYEWANLTGDYTDGDDYERMCRSCHRRYDAGRREGVVACV